MRPAHLAAVCVLVSLATVAGVLTPRRDRDPTAPTGAHYRTLQNATVRVNLPDGGHGSGVIRTLADGSSWVWTCAHVATEARSPAPTPDHFHYRELEITSPVFDLEDHIRGQRVWTARVVRLCVARDVALLQVLAGGQRFPGSLEFAVDDPRVGSPLLVCGSPKGLDASVTRGVFVLPARRPHSRDIDQIDAPSLPGSSGGPVVNARLQIIGLLHGGYGETFSCTVPTRVIREWAYGEGLAFAFDGHTGPAHEPDGPADSVAPIPAAP